MMTGFRVSMSLAQGPRGAHPMGPGNWVPFFPVSLPRHVLSYLCCSIRVKTVKAKKKYRLKNSLGLTLQSLSLCNKVTNSLYNLNKHVKYASD